LYQEAKANLHEPALLGRLIHCLNTVQSLDNGIALEERITRIEQQLGVNKAAKARVNGHARPPAPSWDGLPPR
jgi:hypothetical protein